ncbi:MAG: hypothetical protein AVDCRST_MAG34-257, partial [uncultured Nocardioidaceae bacterium]
DDGTGAAQRRGDRGGGRRPGDRAPLLQAVRRDLRRPGHQGGRPSAASRGRVHGGDARRPRGQVPRARRGGDRRGDVHADPSPRDGPVDQPGVLRAPLPRVRLPQRRPLPRLHPGRPGVPRQPALLRDGPAGHPDGGVAAWSVCLRHLWLQQRGAGAGLRHGLPPARARELRRPADRHAVLLPRHRRHPDFARNASAVEV